MSTQPQVDEGVLRRLKKLLAIANDGRGNEHEMELAAKKAQELMADYNLSLAQVSGAADAAEGGKREKTDLENAGYQWQRDLMGALAELNFCMHWNAKKRVPYSKDPNDFRTIERNTHVLVGREVNVVACREMFKYLHTTIERLVPIESNAQRNSRSAQSWKEGCAHRLVERLKERRAEMEAESARKRDEEAKRAQHPAYAGGNALVVVLGDVYQTEKELNEDFRMGLAPGTTTARRMKREAETAAWLAKWEAERPERERKEREQREREKAEREAFLAAESPADREKRLRKEQREAEKQDRANAKWRERYYSRTAGGERTKQGKPRDLAAYHAGKRAANEIGLDAQVTKKETKAIT